VQHFHVSVGIYQQTGGLQIDCTMGAVSLGQGGYYDGYKPQRNGVDDRKYDKAGKIDSTS
jgi:hypothetical protein